MLSHFIKLVSFWPVSFICCLTLLEFDFFHVTLQQKVEPFFSFDTTFSDQLSRREERSWQVQNSTCVRLSPSVKAKKGFPPLNIYSRWERAFKSRRCRWFEAGGWFETPNVLQRGFFVSSHERPGWHSSPFSLQQLHNSDANQLNDPLIVGEWN